jgi:hypothetical protein
MVGAGVAGTTADTTEDAISGSTLTKTAGSCFAEFAIE